MKLITTFRKRILTMGALIVLPLALAFPSSAFATHAWSTFHWARTSNPMNINLVRHLSIQPNIWPPGYWMAKLGWNTSSKVNFVTVVGSNSAGVRSACSAVAGEVQVCHYNYGSTGWSGLASINFDGSSHITQATAKMNEYYSWKQDSRQSVTCQEIGHTLGLGHQDTNSFNTNLGTCMDYTSSPLAVPNNIALNQHDLNQLNSMYTHTDGYTTITNPSTPAGATFQATSPEMEGIDFNQPDEWGMLIESSDDGRIQVFERHFSDGFGIVTFVTWADESSRMTGE